MSGRWPPSILARVERKIRELGSIRDALARLIEQCKGDHRPDCPIIDELSGEETEAPFMDRNVQPVSSNQTAVA